MPGEQSWNDLQLWKDQRGQEGPAGPRRAPGLECGWSFTPGLSLITPLMVKTNEDDVAMEAPCSCVSAQCSDSFQHFFTSSKGIPPLLKEETISGMGIASTSCCTGCIQLRSIFLLL